MLKMGVMDLNHVKIVYPSHSDELPNVAEQVATDIGLFLEKYKRRSFALRLLSKKTDINEKTLRRLLSHENKPSYPTLLRLYFFLTESTNEQELLQRVPEVVRRELEEKKTSAVQMKLPEKQFDFLSSIEKQPILGELYVLAAMRDIHRHEVILKYGEYGLELLELMVKADLIRAVDKNTFTVSPNGPVFDSKVIKAIGLRFVSRFNKPENAAIRGQNIQGFYATGLTEEAFKKWIAIDEEAYYKKLEIAKQSENKGDVPAFTFQVTDTMLSGGDK